MSFQFHIIPGYYSILPVKRLEFAFSHGIDGFIALTEVPLWKPETGVFYVDGVMERTPIIGAHCILCQVRF